MYPETLLCSTRLPGRKHFPRRWSGIGRTTRRQELHVVAECCCPEACARAHTQRSLAFVDCHVSTEACCLSSMQVHSHLYATNGRMVGTFQRIDIPILREFDQYHYVLFTGNKYLVHNAWVGDDACLGGCAGKLHEGGRPHISVHVFRDPQPCKMHLQIATSSSGNK